MADLKTFRDQVKYYLSQATTGSREKRGMTIEQLAVACGYERSVLSNQLNGKQPISSIGVKKIITVLAERSGITTTGQAKELLALMDAPDFSPADWNAFPLNLLEEGASHNNRWTSTIDTGIPRSFDHFLGREALIQTFVEQLCDNENVKPIALFGNPGVGKTAIATAIARNPSVQRYFQGRILWAGLGTSPDIEGIQRRWSNLLHRQGIETEIGAQPLLLILDDVWDIHHAAKLFQFGRYNNSYRYLITTVPKALADNISENNSFEVPELTIEKGLELLLHLAPTIVQSEKKEARTLVETVGSLPLAIWLTGRYLESQASSHQPRRIQEALKRLHDYEARLQLERLAHDPKAFPSLEEGNLISLDAVIGSRYYALDDNARQMLRALSTFPAKPNTFSEEAASAVVAASGKALRDQLVDAGLVEDVGGDRYALHSTIRDFAFSKLNKEQGESKVANERLAHFFAEYVKTRGVQSFDEVNINYALQWARDNGQNELYLTLASDMQYFWRDYWRVAESMEHLYRGFVAATTTYRETKDPQSLQSMMEVACSYGSNLLVANRLAEANQIFETILQIARGDVPNRLSEEIALFNLGIVALQRGDIDEARDKLEKSRFIRSEEQYQDEWVLDFVTFCRIAQRRSQFEVLKEHFERAIEVDRTANNRRGEAVNLFSLGNIALIRREYKAAGDKYRACLGIVEEFQEKIRDGGAPARWSETILLAQGIVLSVLCEVSLFLGDLKSAKDYLQQSMKINQELKHRREYALNLTYSGRIALADGHTEEANRYYQEALALAQEIQDQHNITAILYSLAILAERKGNLKQAEDFLRKSLQLSKAIESAPDVADSHLQLGYLLLKRGKDREEACAMISTAIQWYSDMEIEDELTQAIAKQFRLMCKESGT